MITPTAHLTARHRYAWALSGLGFLALTALGLAVANILSSGLYPSPFGPPFGPSTDVVTYFTSNRPQVQMMSFLYALGAVCLLVFVGYGAGMLADPTPDRRSALPWLAGAGGALAGGFWLLTALLLWVAAQPETARDPSPLRLIHDLAYLTGGPAHVVTLGIFLGAVSVALRREDVLPGWITFLGQTAGILAVAALLALVAEPESLLLPLGRGLAMLWILATSVALLRRHPGESMVETTPVHTREGLHDQRDKAVGSSHSAAQ
jgi:uncharacterized membrane protein